jgi:hypothetical protein
LTRWGALFCRTLKKGRRGSGSLNFQISMEVNPNPNVSWTTIHETAGFDNNSTFISSGNFT